MSSRVPLRPPAMRPFSSLLVAAPAVPDLRKRVPVSLCAGPNGRGGLMLLWDDDAIKRNEMAITDVFARSLQSLRKAGLSETDRQLHWAAHRYRRLACVLEYLHERKAALPHARDYTFVLVLPLLKDWQRIVDAVYEEPVTFDSRCDKETREAVLAERVARRAARYADLLLKNDGLETPDGRVLSADEIDALDPVLSSTLGTWLAARTDVSPLRKMLILPHSAYFQPNTHDKKENNYASR